jgi:hypothetical protein
MSILKPYISAKIVTGIVELVYKTYVEKQCCQTWRNFDASRGNFLIMTLYY